MSRISTSMPMFRNRGATGTELSQNQLTDSKVGVHPARNSPLTFTNLPKLTSSDGTEMKLQTPVDSIPEAVSPYLYNILSGCAETLDQPASLHKQVP